MRAFAGASGNVLINKNAYRLNSYNVWNYEEGRDSYYRSLLVDLTQPHGEVSNFHYFREEVEVACDSHSNYSVSMFAIYQTSCPHVRTNV